jgi:hypothetical protein
MRTKIVAIAVVALLVAACGGGGVKLPTAAPTQPATTPVPGSYSVEDPAGDCLSNLSQPIACDPQIIDMRRFTIERDPAGNAVLTIEISAAGYPALTAYTLLVGIDTDRNAMTGNTGYARFHGLAPDVELSYKITAPTEPPAVEVRLYPPEANRRATLGDPAMVEWKHIDATHLKATVKPALLGGAEASFFVVTDLELADRYDHIPDNAKVSFPEGRVIPK